MEQPEDMAKSIQGWVALQNEKSLQDVEVLGTSRFKIPQVAMKNSIPFRYDEFIVTESHNFRV